MKKQNHYYDEQELDEGASYYLSEKDKKALQKKVKKESKRSGKKVHRNEPDW